MGAPSATLARTSSSGTWVGCRGIRPIGVGHRANRPEFGNSGGIGWSSGRQAQNSEPTAPWPRRARRVPVELGRVRMESGRLARDQCPNALGATLARAGSSGAWAGWLEIRGRLAWDPGPIDPKSGTRGGLGLDLGRLAQNSVVTVACPTPGPPSSSGTWAGSRGVRRNGRGA